MTHFGRYRLDTIHGFGAFATVWRGFDETLEIPVAIKILAENWANHADVRERFLAEARLLRKISDPRVVRVHDVGVHEDRPFFVMDFVANGTLADRVGRLDPNDALLFAASAARAVDTLHQHGVLHRDVKPSNLLIADDGTVLVSDLGSAKRLAESSGITVTTGTPAYMAPEQARGQGIDVRSDVYALGVVTYELLAGKPPFDGADPAASYLRAPDIGPPQLDRLTGLPRALDRVIARAVAVRPADRPPSAGALAVALESIATGTKIKVKKVRPTLSAGGVAVVALMAFVASGLATWFMLTR